MNNIFKIINANKAIAGSLSGKGINIAIVDTGCFRHSSIKNNIVYFKDYINNNKFSYDDNGHGTHIAGIIAAKKQKSDDEYGMEGLAPNANLFIFKALDGAGNGDMEKMMRALDDIEMINKTRPIHILNFSIGVLATTNIDSQKQLLRKIDKLWDEGITVVTAAGNNGPKKNSITVPGVSRKVITVGAIDDYIDGEIYYSTYSGRGPTSCCVVKPEILAPGTGILSLKNKEGKYQIKSGTSMATPFVSAALALALEKKNSLKPSELKLLLYYSRKVNILYDERYGWGILDVDKMLGLI